MQAVDDVSFDLFAQKHAKELENFVTLIEKETKFLGDLSGP
jgi:hypothetical protein